VDPIERVSAAGDEAQRPVGLPERRPGPILFGSAHRRALVDGKRTASTRRRQGTTDRRVAAPMELVV
jgi:hypothetical protein